MCLFHELVFGAKLRRKSWSQGRSGAAKVAEIAPTDLELCQHGGLDHAWTGEHQAGRTIIRLAQRSWPESSKPAKSAVKHNPTQPKDWQRNGKATLLATGISEE